MVEIEHPRGSSLLIRHVQKFEMKDKTEVPLQLNMDRYTKGTGRLGNPTTHINLKEKGVILTSLDKERYEIIKKIESNTIRFSEVADMPRGVSVNSSEYSPTANEGFIQVLGGTNVERYTVKEGNKRKPNRYLRKTDKRIAQKANIFSNKRIIYQNVASSVPRIVATLEQNMLPTDDTVNNIVLTDASLKPEYLLGILNSDLMTFYLKYAIINCSILTVHLDKSYIGKIPLKKPSAREQEKIIEIVNEITSKKNRLNKFFDKKTAESARLEEETNKAIEALNDAVYSLYCITSPKEIELIKR